ncbi:MAG: DUF359 domain-containing protein, partial [bacterium]|nr:DUF359 domain-containing protein [bacterium]
TVIENGVTITDKQRAFLSKPVGDKVDHATFDKVLKPPFRAIIGDTSLETFIKQEWAFDLGIYDGVRQRAAVSSEAIDSLTPHWTVTNPAGQVTPELVTTLESAITPGNKAAAKYLKVKGEEDLATTALILLSPLDTELYYGSPLLGLMRLTVTEELKNSVYTNFHASKSE